MGIMISLATFGAMATWLMILLTHVVFRRKLRRAGSEPGFRLPGLPAVSLVGAALLAGLLVTSLFTEQFRLTLVFGIPFVLLISAAYGLLAHRQRALNSEPVSSGSTGNY